MNKLVWHDEVGESFTYNEDEFGSFYVWETLDCNDLVFYQLWRRCDPDDYIGRFKTLDDAKRVAGIILKG